MSDENNTNEALAEGDPARSRQPSGAASTQHWAGCLCTRCEYRRLEKHLVEAHGFEGPFGTRSQLDAHHYRLAPSCPWPEEAVELPPVQTSAAGICAACFTPIYGDYVESDGKKYCRGSCSSIVVAAPVETTIGQRPGTLSDPPSVAETFSSHLIRERADRPPKLIGFEPGYAERWILAARCVDWSGNLGLAKHELQKEADARAKRAHDCHGLDVYRYRGHPRRCNDALCRLEVLEGDHVVNSNNGWTVYHLECRAFDLSYELDAIAFGVGGGLSDERGETKASVPGETGEIECGTAETEGPKFSGSEQARNASSEPAPGTEGDRLYRCASPHCPGLPYKASDRPHPAECVVPAAADQPIVERNTSHTSRIVTGASVGIVRTERGSVVALMLGGRGPGSLPTTILLTPPEVFRLCDELKGFAAQIPSEVARG